MHPPAAEHPLCIDLALLARRSEPDLVLKARYLGLRKEIMSAVGRRVPGLVARLVAEEVERLADTVLTECRQWRETGDWPDHQRHMQNLRAAAAVHLYLSTEGLGIVRDCDPSPTRHPSYVRQFRSD